MSPRPKGIHTPWLHDRSVPRSPRGRPEYEIQERLRAIYTAVGCKVYWLSQQRASTQTAGLPDLMLFHPVVRAAWSHEVKTPTGRVSKAQQEYARLAGLAGWTHLIGGLDVAEAHLESLGLMRREHGQLILTPKREAAA